MRYAASMQAVLNLSNGRIVAGNETARRLFGLGDDGFGSQSLSSLSADFQSDGRSSYARLEALEGLAARQGSAAQFWLFRRAEGSVFPAHLLLNADSDGLTAFILPVEPKDETPEAAYRALSSHLVLAELTLSGEIIFASNRFLDLFGLTRNMIKGRRLAEFCAETPEKFLNEAGSGKSVQTGLVCQTADGLPLPVNCSFVPVRLVNGEIVKLLFTAEKEVAPVSIAQSTRAADPEIDTEKAQLALELFEANRELTLATARIAALERENKAQEEALEPLISQLQDVENYWRTAAQSASVYRAIPGMVYKNIMGKRMKFKLLNNRIETDLGYPLSDFTGDEPARRLLDLIHPDDMSLAVETIALSAQNLTPYCIRYRLRHADGSYRLYEDNGRPYYDHELETTVIEGVSCDITAADRREKLIESLTLVQKQTLNALSEGVYGVDTNGRLTFINPMGARLLGYEPDELIGVSVKETLHHTTADGQPMAEESCPICSTIRDRQARSSWNDVVWKKNGDGFFIHYNIEPLYENEVFVGLIAAFRVANQDAEAPKPMSETKINPLLADFLDQQTAVEFTLDPATHLVRLDPKLTVFLGLNENEWPLDLFLLQCVHPDDWVSAREGLEQAARQNAGASGRFVSRFRLNAETFGYFEIYWQREATQINGLALNVTQQAETENALQQALTDLAGHRARMDWNSEALQKAHEKLRKTDAALEAADWTLFETRIRLADAGALAQLSGWALDLDHLTVETAFGQMAHSSDAPTPFDVFLRSRIHPEDQDSLRRNLETLLLQPEVSPIACRYRARNPESMFYRSYTALARCLLDESAAPQKIVTTERPDELNDEENGLALAYKSAIDINSFLKSVYDIFKQQAQQRGLAFLLNVAPNVPEEIFAVREALEMALLGLLDKALDRSIRNYIILEVGSNDQEFLSFTARYYRPAEAAPDPLESQPELELAIKQLDAEWLPEKRPDGEILEKLILHQ